MRIGVIIIDQESPTVRYRIYKYLPFLEEKGIYCHFFTLPDNAFQRYKLFRELREYDIVLVIKKLLSPWDVKVLRYFCNIIIFDFDDAIMFRDSLENYYSFKRKLLFASTLKNADYIICGNELLKLLSYCYNSRITVLPTSIDINDYLKVNEDNRLNDKFTIGWIGTKGSLKYLETIRPAIENAGKKVDIKIKIICNAFIEFENVEVEKVLWSEEDELRELKSVDVGIMPLPDTPYSTGKCAFKIVQYFGLKLPVIASPVGVNKELVKPYISGLMASSLDEWEQSILYCAQNRHEIRQWGENGFKIVNADFTVQANADKLIDLLERAVST